MRIEVVTPPSPAPVTVDEARDYLRVTSTDEDPLIEMFVEAARRQVETVTGYAIGEQTRRLVLDTWPPGWGVWTPWHLPLPTPPLHSVETVEYLDVAGDVQEWDAGGYTAETSGTPGAVCLVPGAAWPPNGWSGRRPGLLRVTYVCGFGKSGAEPVPEPLRLAILTLVAHWYENRTPVEVGTITSAVPMTLDYLTATHRFRYRLPS